MAVTTVATLDDLYREEGKAELIGGKNRQIDAHRIDAGYCSRKYLCRSARVFAKN
jgi:hypothetical protein